jgi:uncharacterized protein YbaA (DUF1428 family)
MSYIDGFVIPVRADRKEAFRAHALKAAAVFKRLGAERVVECWGDDVPDGTRTDFKRAVAAEPGEAVVFSWIVWPSKAVRDAASQKMMSDPDLQPGSDMPFDGKRMIYGGFEPVVEFE